MFPTFFKHKMREVGSFLRIMKGKVTGNPEERKKGVDQALNAMKDERQVYENEKAEAERGVDSDIPLKKGQEKVLRESGGQDISAI